MKNQDPIDHLPLQWFFCLKYPNSKLVKWHLKLEQFHYEVIYEKGKFNTNAKAACRIEINTKEIYNFGESL